MFYHNILHDDMRNGDGLRVTLFVSGCDHHCKECHNPQTWDYNSGIEFDMAAKEEIFEQLNEEYISGITFTGGDPLHENNLKEVLELINEIRLSFGSTKTIWIYSGYTWEQTILNTTDVDWVNNLLREEIISRCDVMVDGQYIDSQRDIKLKWCGSSNQRVIDIQKSLKEGTIILWDTN